MSQSYSQIGFSKEEFLDLAEMLTAIANGTSDKQGILFGDPSSGSAIRFVLLSEEDAAADKAKIAATEKAIAAGFTSNQINVVRKLSELAGLNFVDEIDNLIGETKEAGDYDYQNDDTD